MIHWDASGQSSFGFYSGGVVGVNIVYQVYEIIWDFKLVQDFYDVLKLYFIERFFNIDKTEKRWFVKCVGLFAELSNGEYSVDTRSTFPEALLLVM